ncbi:MAG: hypothetical protein IAE96_10365 [Chitinophagaceae bacterium]|nr:hypothetical protein [Chitinophagaceae bacterium]
MNKNFMNIRVLTIALVTLFTTSFAGNANAGEKKPALPAEIRYVGKVENSPVFELNIPSTGVKDDYVISVKDEYGNTLHAENIKADGFTKKFMLALEDNTEYTIQFVIHSKNTKRSVLYTINNNTRTTEEVVVSKR